MNLQEAIDHLENEGVFADEKTCEAVRICLDYIHKVSDE